MRLVFAGTPAVAVPSLRALAAGPHEIVAVVTRGDAPLGRKRVLTPSPVAQAADELGIPTIKADRLDADVTERIAELAPDLGVIVAYGGLVREPLLSTPAHGWINLHFSLLPRWRGAAPVQRALIAGDTVTGASVFQLVAALDAGDVFAEERYEVPPGATTADVLDALADIGSPVLARVVDGIADGTAVATAQRGEPTLAPKLTLDDGVLDFTQDAETLLHRIAGVTPEPGAHTTLDGARFKVLRAAPSEAPPLTPGRVAASGKDVIVGTGTAPLRLETVQPAGKGAMAAGDWFRGLRTDEPVLGA
ncbi:methionyl-tRNA formyltransferase [uncultured Microbacterium sp.]|uniref:methionyl-tRNA formyltransferase n=1 Tax=uncultured Microbacterium sp. TaxID=191216 RepID=UPI0028D61D9B|nr:methionyl-tRNA formyltransferase [uncultured Microbacterium sp.]